MLKNESGVHRLVRISPFNAKSLRHTSFSMVEVIPEFEKNSKVVELKPDDLKIELSKSGGPGGQNVNKRETAVRVVHLPTNLSVHVTSERSQEQNKEKALEMLKGKLFKKMEADKAREKEGYSVSKTTEIEWGSQIRSYVLHPYKLVKDHRTEVEIRDVDAVLLNGQIDEFIEAEANL
jgi:peptide chain release factor 2